MHAIKVDGELVILNISTDDVLACTKSPIVRSKVINHLKIYFPLAQKEGVNIKFLNCITIQSKDYMSMDQTYCIFKMIADFFKNARFYLLMLHLEWIE